MNKKVSIIGGGASGLMAAIFAAQAGHHVTIFEKGQSCGKKLLVSGKGRCNITNMSDIANLERNIPSNPRFLRHSFYNFTPQATLDFFNKIGVDTKIERGNRAFPISDNAADVRDALIKEAKKSGVEILLNSPVTKIITQDAKVKGIILKNKEYPADAVILTTGGKAFPGTGSTGDGAALSGSLGHKIIQLEPSLTGINVKEKIVQQLQGLSLKNVCIKIIRDTKVVYKEFGEMLFTHYGLSGPIILSASRHALPQDIISIDLKPALSDEELDKRLLKDFEKFANKFYKNSFDDLLPKSLIPFIIDLSGIDSDKKINNITKQERKNLLSILKNLNFTVENLRPFTEAIVTKGGVDTREINAKTMESKLITGLYFAGEIIDVDGYTGGFNLQIAWSTGKLAGESV